MKKIFVPFFADVYFFRLNAQKYFTKEGKVNFDCSTSIEKIAAVNSKATSVVDFATGAIEWGVLVKAFKFEKALMQNISTKTTWKAIPIQKQPLRVKSTTLHPFNWARTVPTM